jgi:hypothetical protein
MGRISCKINLAALKNAAIITSGKNKDVDCILIPIAQNHLFRSDKGSVYLDLIGFETPVEKRKGKDTHLVKQSLSKDIQDKMTEEEKKAMPILGNFIDWDQAGESQSAPAETGAVVADGLDDLPF